MNKRMKKKTHKRIVEALNLPKGYGLVLSSVEPIRNGFDVGSIVKIERMTPSVLSNAIYVECLRESDGLVQSLSNKQLFMNVGRKAI